jgi:hypothetical protein
MRDPVIPKSTPERKPLLGKWTLLALLVALVAFMYVSIMVKIARHGF